jgi:predicted nucleotidyltransferase/DNA-binding HxlR family transcriptional regulator
LIGGYQLAGLEVLSREGALDILSCLGAAGGLGFSELKPLTKTAKTLSSRLKELSEAGLIAKDRRVYTITESGRDVLKLARELERRIGGEAKSPIRVDQLSRVCVEAYREYLRGYVEALSRHFGGRLVSVVVFGSVARGRARVNEGDIDVLVIVEDWRAEAWERLEELAGVEEELRKGGLSRLLAKRGIWPVLQNYPLSREEAGVFQRIYLDMVFEAIVLYDLDGFFESLMDRLRRRLAELGSRRVQLPDGSWYWVLKPDLKFGEDVTI